MKNECGKGDYKFELVNHLGSQKRWTPNPSYQGENAGFVQSSTRSITGTSDLVICDSGDELVGMVF